MLFTWLSWWPCPLTWLWVAHVMSHPLISMIWSPGCSLPSLATRPSGNTCVIMSSSSCHHYHVIMCDISHMSVTSWTTTQRRGVSAPPTMVTPRLAEVRGISTWLTSPSRIGSRVMPATTMRTWNWKRNDMSKSTIQRNSNFLIYDDPLVLMCTFSLILLFLNSVLLTELSVNWKKTIRINDPCYRFNNRALSAECPINLWGWDWMSWLLVLGQGSPRNLICSPIELSACTRITDGMMGGG